jgi:hypothetical protein
MRARIQFSSHIAFATCILFPFLSNVPLGQADEPALPPFSTERGAVFDSVDQASGRVLITFPILQKVGKIPFSFKLVGSFNTSSTPKITLGTVEGDLEVNVSQSFPLSCPSGEGFVWVVDALGTQHPACYGIPSNNSYPAIDRVRLFISANQWSRRVAVGMGYSEQCHDAAGLC